MIASGINLVMTVIGFAVSTMFIVFVCTRLICARIQLSASRRAFPNASRSHHLSILERHAHGLEPVVISSFPTKKFADKYFSFEEDTQCTVCLAEYQEKDILRILPYCGHAFHVGCIDIWLRQQSTCPVCRVSLRNYSDRKQILQPLYSAPIRSHDIPDTFISDGRHCLFNDHEYSLATRNNHPRNMILEDQIRSEAIGEAVCHISEISNRSQPARLQESKLKLMESSSHHQEIE